MPELLKFKYHFESGTSDICLVSLASSRPNLMDSKFNVPKQIQPLERLQRIRKSSNRDLKILTFSAPFPLYDSPNGMNKAVLETRMREIDAFIVEIAKKERLNFDLNKIILVLSGESCVYGPFLYFFDREKYRNLILINPYYDFYDEMINIIENPFSFKKYFPIFNVNANLNDPKIFGKEKFLSKLNLFIYSQGDRYEVSRTISEDLKKKQKKLITLLDMSNPKHLSRSFYIHFKREEKTKDYKTNINLFINKYFFSPNDRVELDSSLRKNLLSFDIKAYQK